ncbi:MAG: sensor histidine kinase [Bdellovibrio sp.]|nr:sensor histidine kinase [Bdellovibrio sp.]
MTKNNLKNFSEIVRENLLSNNVRHLSEITINQCNSLNLIDLKYDFNQESIQIFCSEKRKSLLSLVIEEKIFFDFSKVNKITSIFYKIDISKQIKTIFLLTFGLALLNLIFYRFIDDFYSKKNTSYAYFKSQELKINLSRKLAHDIRSPLSTLNLISSKIDNVQAKELQIAVISQINQIAEELLNDTRSNQTLDYSQLIDQLESEYKLKSESLQRKFKFIRESKFRNIKCPDFLYSIINNIIQNSIDATEPGKGQIKITSTLSEAKILICITDNGRGMPKDILDVIGLREISFGKSEEGNGIGLYSATQALKKMGGLLEVNSVLNKGTSITLHVPNK